MYSDANMAMQLYELFNIKLWNFVWLQVFELNGIIHVMW